MTWPERLEPIDGWLPKVGRRRVNGFLQYKFAFSHVHVHTNNKVIRHEPYSINSDIYSFGLVLWQLVTNSPRPFSTKSPIQTAFAAAKGERPLIPSFVSDYIARIIKACWDHDQLRRPSFAFCSIALAQYSRAATLNAEELQFSVHSVA